MFLASQQRGAGGRGRHLGHFDALIDNHIDVAR